MTQSKDEKGVLSGYRVLDITNETGLLCGKVLGDYGADVIKIEPPGGDPARDQGPFYKDIADRNKSLFWFYTNTSKRGITLNLETCDGREIFKRLVKTAHFVIESFKPGYLAQLGLAYSDLEAINPGLVMTSITPYGQNGPYAGFKAEDINVAAMGGFIRLFGDSDRAPVRVSQPQFFFHGALHGAVGSMLAHYHRELTGEGQYVDTSCQQAAIHTLMNVIEIWDVNRVNYRGGGPFSIINRPPPVGPIFHRRIWACKDGHVCFLVGGGGASGLRRSSEFFVEWANSEGYALDIKDLDWTGREFNYSQMLQSQWEVIENALMPFLLTKTKAELFRKAVEHSIMLCPVNMADDILEDKHLNARGYWQEIYHDELKDTIVYPGPPVRLGALPWRIQRRAPLIGEHNEEILSGELGLSKEQITLLKSRGVV